MVGSRKEDNCGVAESGSGETRVTRRETSLSAFPWLRYCSCASRGFDANFDHKKVTVKVDRDAVFEKVERKQHIEEVCSLKDQQLFRRRKDHQDRESGNGTVRKRQHPQQTNDCGSEIHHLRVLRARLRVNQH
jgi:hypothetical protein